MTLYNQRQTRKTNDPVIANTDPDLENGEGNEQNEEFFLEELLGELDVLGEDDNENDSEADEIIVRSQNEPADAELGTDWLEDGNPIHLDEVEDRHSIPTYSRERKITPAGVILPVVLLIITIFATVGLRFIKSANPAKNYPISGMTNASHKIKVSKIAPFFSQSVLYWEGEIIIWAERHNLDPNMVATVMQIESCGDPKAVSSAGAMGLFQVMPFHFHAGEDGFDPETNALRGMNYLAERLIQTDGEIGHAFAGYNGGQAAAASNWNNWSHETQRYYVWATGLYSDGLSSNRTSKTLDEWLAAGGTSLCIQAEHNLGLN